MKKKGYVTIKDLAEELGISASTVSRALRDLPDVKEETRAAVKALAAAWHYAPNLFASSLVKSQSNLLGVIVPEIVSNFFTRIIRGIQEKAYDKGYRVIICDMQDRPEREALDLHALLSARVAGIIAAPAAGLTQDYNHWHHVVEQGLPLVFVDRIQEHMDVHSVEVDDFQASLRATQRLLDQGCKHILHLAGPPGLTVSRRREQGYIAAHKYAGLEPNPAYIRETGFYQEEAEAVMEAWMAEGNPLDGILGINDMVCIGAMQVLKRHKIQIPEEVSLIGFSDHPSSSLYTPALSTVSQPAEEIGRQAFQLLLDQIESASDSHTPAIRKRLETTLVMRETCRVLERQS